MLISFNDRQSKHVAKLLGDTGKLTYLGSAATPLFGERSQSIDMAVGFILASLLVWLSIKVLE